MSLLFRAWDKEDKKMHYDVSVFDKKYFNEIYKINPPIVEMKLNEQVNGITGISHINKGTFICVSSAYEHLMICTYIKDKNGKLIYEGDIIKTWWQHCGVTNYDYEIIGVITYSKEIVGFAINSELYSGSLSSHDDNFLHKDKIEVIGNIYENPEEV